MSTPIIERAYGIRAEEMRRYAAGRRSFQPEKMRWRVDGATFFALRHEADPFSGPLEYDLYTGRKALFGIDMRLDRDAPRDTLVLERKP